MTRILVIGLSGQVGEALLPRLLERAIRVLALSRRERTPQPGVQWILGSLEAMPELPSDVTAILSLGPLDAFAAWMAGTGEHPDVALGGPGASAGIIAVTFSFIFVDDQGVPTDVNGDQYLDTALAEVYYNSYFGDPTGTRAGNRWGPQVFTDKNLKLVEKLIVFAQSRNQTLLDLAFGWLASHDYVPSVIAGATKPEQVSANAAAGEWKLTAEEMAEVDGLTARA